MRGKAYPRQQKTIPKGEIMASIPQKVVDRCMKNVLRFQKILEDAKHRDLNETDTVTIVKDMLSDVFGYDKYTEITSEYPIRGTKCDIAVKMGDKVQFLIEVKNVGKSLDSHHLKQAVDYGANQGILWVVLTNGINWKLYKINLKQKINFDLVSAFSFLEINPRKAEDREKLFLLSKQGMLKAVHEDFYERSQYINRFVIAAILQTNPILSEIRRELKKAADGIHVEIEEIASLLTNAVLKGEVVNGEEADKAAALVRKQANKAMKAIRRSDQKKKGSSTDETTSS
jgi:hypothetical protein